MEDIIETVTGSYYSTRFKKDDSTIIDIVSKDKNIPSDAIGKEKIKGGYKLTVLGKNLPCESRSLTTKFYGHWVENKKFGMQFACTYYEILPPDTKTGIRMYLRSLKIKGVGKITCERIVLHFGTDTLRICMDEYERLTEITGISLAKAKTVHDAVIATKDYNKLAIFLGQYNVLPKQIMAISKELGGRAIEKITEDPFRIIEIPGIGFNTADTIARGLKVMLSSEKRISEAIMAVLNMDSLISGNLFTPETAVKKAALEALNKGFNPPVVTSEMYDRVMNKMKGASKEDMRLVYRFNSILYTKENELAEREPVLKLIKMNSNKIEASRIGKYQTSLKHYCDGCSIKPSQKQQDAVILSLSNRASIITGGPGTGKTTITKAIIKSYAEVNPKRAITLLAPTGKAARRMSESTGYPASTIHSALQIYPSEENGFSFETREIPNGLVIVDEFSMVDQYLMQKLMNNINGNDTQLVMIGDVDQLPSVSAGEVLREMILSEVIPTTRLTEIFRQKEGSTIIDNAIKINTGLTNLKFDRNFELISSSGEDDALSRIVRIYMEHARKYGCDNVMLLCPYRKSIGGRQVCVDVLNQKIQTLINPKVADDVTMKIGTIEFRTGDTVIQKKNREFASNGDVGTIEDIFMDKDDDMEEKVVRISFDSGNVVEYTAEEMEDVDLAYAISIHKSQGSQYRSVIIPWLEEQKNSFLTRNLLYTAVTRAVEVVTIVGSMEALRYSIGNKGIGKRNTLMAKRLIKNSINNG